MKLSVIISIYNSHGALERQTKHFKGLDLDIEYIFVDDGSDPPLTGELGTFYQTNNKLAWTQGLGRNLGASKATGEYLLMTDIDHILTKEALEDVLNFDGDFMRFPRFFGILDENGELKTDKEYLKSYGIKPAYLNMEEMRTNVHRNTFAIRKEIFDILGGYDDAWCTYGFHPKTRRGDDCYFDGVWRRFAKKKGMVQVMGSKIYVFPNGRFHKDGDKNPFGLFHDLHHKEERFYK